MRTLITIAVNTIEYRSIHLSIS